jgi:hypothetical protein
LTALLLLILSSCGVLDSPQNPDEALHVLALEPETLVTRQHFASLPDSGGTGTLTHLRFALSAAERQALQTGAILECVLSVSAGDVMVEGWQASTSEWNLLLKTTISDTDPHDLWWRGGWIEPFDDLTYLGTDNRVRLSVTPGAEFERSILRIIDISSGLDLYQAPSGGLTSKGALTLSEGGLAIMQSDSIELWNSEGEEQAKIATADAPGSFCRHGSYFYGVGPTEIRRVPVTGGRWQRVALLPWTVHGGVAITSDSSDLYLIRYPAEGESVEFPKLFKLSESRLYNTSSFTAALKDTMTLRRNGMPGGNASGLAWWNSERLLVAPGTQEGVFGLVTFSRGGWFQDFIPLPFEPGGVKLALIGRYLFIGNATPTLKTLAWNQVWQPASPPDGFIYRFTVK